MRLSPLALCLVLTACSSGASTQPSASATSVPSSPSSEASVAAMPTSEPSPAASSTPPTPTTQPDLGWGFLPPGSDARVTVDGGLRLRAEPGTGSAILATLAKGTLVEIFGPPWQRDAGDAFEWQRVLVQSADEHQVGWVATIDPGTFLALEPIDCPTGPIELDIVLRMRDLARLTCLGGQELTLEGTVVTGFGGMILGTFEPGWLAGPFGFSGAIAAAGGACCFFYHQPPGSEPIFPLDGDRLRLTGHFDDPAATTCRIATGDPPIPEPDELAVVYCRERFVATSVEIVGR